ncbi:uncharacterized protein LOC123556103 [Mercenaria mercenaria]|uniref:uncharacterized protein LOC123556103 n=1 Tax=Mercenaria mercenaria TaxID=6596 RepID=UPI00234FA152|nr:uncharacterized protein LOC123556103 [Mercenaria mercenaria]
MKTGIMKPRETKQRMTQLFTLSLPVRISTSSPTVDIGSTANMTCELDHIRGWSTIEILKNCSNTEFIIASLQNNQSESNFTIEKHISLSEKDFALSWAKLVLHFKNVTCSDACGQGGEIEYMCAVKIGDSWVTGSVKLEFQFTDDKDGVLYHCETSYENVSKRSNVETINVTDPILYFSDESKTAIVGSSKVIQCILTSTMNMTYIVISKYNSEICNVSSTGVGSCSRIGFSAYGMFSHDDTIFNTTVKFENVSCDHYGTYTCRAVGTAIFKTSMEFLVKSIQTVPELRLSTTLVEDQKAEWEDQLKCTAKLGYPEKRRRLEVQIRLKSSDVFKAYDTLIKEGGDCRQNASIYLRQAVFRKEHNGSTIRCVILDNEDEVIANSTEKELKLLKNICQAEGNILYDLHPYSCRRYVECGGGRLYDRECAEGSCASLDDPDFICGKYDCNGCR